jgi:hypothetical protein
MTDKTIENVYVWYSGATDITGKKITEALGCKGGKKLPVMENVCMIVGWGTKTNDDVNITVPVLNHPNVIRVNRNKFDALLKIGSDIVPAFCSSEDVFHELDSDKKGTVKFPLIGRTKYHQGGKGFWYCPTKTHVMEAINQGAQYFQNMVEIKDEYRLHVFGDKVLHLVKKVKRTIPEIEEAFVRQEFERQKSLAEKNGDAFDEEMVKTILQRQAKSFAQNGPDMLIRSNRMGWRFAPMNSIECPKGLAEVAVKAVKNIGLDFGAVDCCLDASGKAFVIEVNSGPGLEGSAFNKWATSFEKAISEKLKVKDEVKIEDKPKAHACMCAENKCNHKDSGKEKLKVKLELIGQFLEQADDNDTAVIEKLFRKAFQ